MRGRLMVQQKPIQPQNLPFLRCGSQAPVAADAEPYIRNWSSPVVFQQTKLQRAVERLIDSFSESLIEKNQFASRMARTKSRIADVDARIKVYAGDVDQREHLRSAMNRLRELAATVGPDLESADWQRKREIIRTVVHQIDIDTDVIKIMFRVNRNTRGSDSDAIAITLPRPSKRFR